MEWVKCSERLPKYDSCVLVCNLKGWMGVTKALFHSHYNVFVLDNPNLKYSLTLECTHWCQIPDLPKIDEDQMDKKIKKIEAKEKSALKDTKELLKMDKKRDKVCEMGAKMMKKKKIHESSI